MRSSDKNENKAKIIVYQSIWKNILLIACFMAFAVGGYIILTSPITKWPMKVFGGLLNMMVWGCGSLIFTFVTLYKRIIPCLIIYKDRLEFRQKQNRKYVYKTVNFVDVRKFIFVNKPSIKMIAIDYKTTSMIHQSDESSDFKQKQLHDNFNESGAFENIPINNLTMRGKDICDILNKRLKNNNFCLVCGYSLGNYNPYGNNGKTPTYDICPCCGVEWGNEDYTPESRTKYRNRWLESGTKWFEPEKKSKNWNLEQQLRNIGCNEADR